MAHGVSNQYTDNFTATNVGQTIPLPVATDPDFPIRAHAVSVGTGVGTITGAFLTYDVQLKDGTFIDSGQPSILATGVAPIIRYDTILSTSAIKGFRTRMNNWTGGTSMAVVTTVVFLL